MLILIDNYDSFTYNLVHYFQEIGQSVRVFRNDEISVKKIFKLKPRFLVISPGPSSPKNSGICLELIKKNSKLPKPIPFGLLSASFGAPNIPPALELGAPQNIKTKNGNTENGENFWNTK